MAKKVKTNINVDNLSGLFYIDYKDIFHYNKPNESDFLKEKEINPADLENYEFNQTISQAYYDKCLDKISTYLADKFDSISKVDEREKKKHIIAKNHLFEIAIEDNNWSVAIQLLPIKKANKGLQKQMYYAFLHGLRNALFEEFDTLYVRNGSWSQIPITKNDDPNLGNWLVDEETPLIRLC